MASNSERAGAPVTMNARCTSASQSVEEASELGIAHVGAHVLELAAGDHRWAEIKRTNAQ